MLRDRAALLHIPHSLTAAWAAALVASLSGIGCSSQSTSDREAPREGERSVAAAATNGLQRVQGMAPPQSLGFPAIVILDPTVAGEPTAQSVLPYMDQVQETFIPSLLLVRTGQPVEFRNHDEVLHNVRVREETTRTSAFNVAITAGDKFTFVFARDGFYDVGCDIHPGMSSQVVAITSPYATTADAAGHFVIADVPSGTYHATVYSGTQKIERETTVAAGAPVLDLTHP